MLQTEGGKFTHEKKRDLSSATRGVNGGQDTGKHR